MYVLTSNLNTAAKKGLLEYLNSKQDEVTEVNFLC